MVDIERKDDDDDSGAGSMILSDIREIYESKKLIKLFSQELVDYLIELEDRPLFWSNPIGHLILR